MSWLPQLFVLKCMPVSAAVVRVLETKHKI